MKKVLSVIVAVLLVGALSWLVFDYYSDPEPLMVIIGDKEYTPTSQNGGPFKKDNLIDLMNESCLEDVEYIDGDDAIYLKFGNRQPKSVDVITWDGETEFSAQFDEERQLFKIESYHQYIYEENFGNPYEYEFFDNPILLVADFGLKNWYYCIDFYCNDYEPKIMDEPNGREKSFVTDKNLSSEAKVIMDRDAYNGDSFPERCVTLKNESGADITFAPFIGEKYINGEWYQLERRTEEILATDDTDKENMINAGETKKFDCIGVISAVYDVENINEEGYYRLVVPYELNEKTYYAVSDSFAMYNVSNYPKPE